jgi:DNA invertase Pin-like site-specific DNA recombinase
MLIGYARVSTIDQETATQVAADGTGLNSTGSWTGSAEATC